jgi:hypothetical protein
MQFHLDNGLIGCNISSNRVTNKTDKTFQCLGTAVVAFGTLGRDPNDARLKDREALGLYREDFRLQGHVTQFLQGSSTWFTKIQSPLVDV